MSAAEKSDPPRSERNAPLELPDKFIALCREEGATPNPALRNFIAELRGIILHYLDRPREDGSPWWNTPPQ